MGLTGAGLWGPSEQRGPPAGGGPGERQRWYASSQAGGLGAGRKVRPPSISFPARCADVPIPRSPARPDRRLGPGGGLRHSLPQLRLGLLLDEQGPAPEAGLQIPQGASDLPEHRPVGRELRPHRRRGVEVRGEAHQLPPFAASRAVKHRVKRPQKVLRRRADPQYKELRKLDSEPGLDG